ncbi:MAG: aldo/keto reductase [Vicinamibacterales bacterium]|nr:aldo/keto reductase [Vicinamibacterales bacterium]
MAKAEGTTRREFLEAGASGVAGAALGFGCSRARTPDTSQAGSSPLVTRALGRTGLTLPVVSIGSAYEAGIVRAALDAGLTYVHTSGSYADQNHERMLNRVFRGRPRDSFVVGSSPDFPEYRFGGGGLSEDLGTRSDAATIAPFLEGSLQRLGLGHLDIYYLASINDPATVLHEPYVKAYEALKRAGKIRLAGIATHRNEPAVIRAAAKSGVWDVVLTAFNFRQTHREDVRAAIHEAAEAGLGVIAMKTQAGVYWDSRRQQKINMKAALRWVLRDEHVHSTVPAFSNYDELEHDLAVARDPALGPDEERDLRLGQQAGLPGLYCQQCGACLPQCPEGVDVPSLMRGYMYAVGHGRPQHARHALRAWTPSGIPCTTCTDCPVRCVLGFDVRERARAVAAMLDAGAAAV